MSLRAFIALFLAGASLVVLSESTFGLTIDAALKQTMDRNAAIQQARLDLERATGRKLVFRSIAYPNAIIGGAAGLQGGHRSGEKKTQPFGFGYGGLEQPIFNAAIPATMRRGNIEVLIAQQQLNMAVNQQLESARVSYYTGAYNQALASLGEEQRQRLQGVTDAQQARYEAGLADRGVFIGAQMQTRELDPRIAAAARAGQGAQLQLAEVMGDDLTGRYPVPVLESRLEYRPFDIDVAATTAAALDRRADLELARLLVRTAREDERIMEAAYYPNINLQLAGEYIPVSGVHRQGQGTPHRSDDIISSELREGAAYSWRVIDNGAVTGAVRERRSAREINEILLHKMEADIPREVLRVRNDLDAIARKYQALSHATVAAEQTAATTNANLASGVTSALETRLAENASLEVRTQLLTLAYQQQLALAELDRITGRYLQFSDQRP